MAFSPTSSGLIAGGIGAGSQIHINNKNIELAKQMQKNQMKYGAVMSSTAITRAVNDMYRAGINPVALAGSGGNITASTPSAPGQNPLLRNPIGGGISSASQMSEFWNKTAMHDKIVADAKASEETSKTIQQEEKIKQSANDTTLGKAAFLQKYYGDSYLSALGTAGSGIKGVKDLWNSWFGNVSKGDAPASVKKTGDFRRLSKGKVNVRTGEWFPD